MTITAVSAGAVDYLLRGSGCAQHAHASSPAEAGVERAVDLDGGGAQYLLASAEHEPAGVWFGAGLEMVGIAPGTQAGEADVRAVFGKLQHPSAVDEDGSPAFLGRRPRQFRSTADRVAARLAAEPDASEERIREISNEVRASGRKPVAYYDLTFSPVKSVSVLHAALLAEGRTADAAKVVGAHREAIAEAMAWAEEQAAYTRSGYHGKTVDGRSVGVYERATGLVWTRWDHSTNRNQEPQLHSHVAVLNRVVTASDGEIRALDGAGFKPIKQGIDALYRSAYERLLGEWLGVVFAQRPDGKAREILGIDQELLAAASGRARQVEANLEVMVREFEATHGRAPSPAQRKAMHHRAWAQDRAAKTHDVSPRRQLDNWAATRRGELRTSLVNAAGHAQHVAEYGHPDQRDYAHRTREEVLAAAVEAVQAQYPTWRLGNLIDEIEKQVRRTPSMVGSYPELANEVLRQGARYGVVAVTAPDPGPVPVALQREDGKSKYRALNDERYTTVDQLATEVGIVARARLTGAPALAGAELELARVELIAAGLGPDQQAAVLGILSSGRCGDVLIGPAGAGKSTTVGALARTWEDRVGGRVIGLATSQAAAMVLADDGVAAVNTTVFLNRFTPDANGNVAERVRPGDLFILDEAGMSSTAELEAISRIVATGGGKLLYTGDHEQLVAVGAGGMLELLARDNGAFELTEVHRFTQEWEREASVRLRAGDESVLDLYETHGRLRGGTRDEMATAAVRGYLADTIAGKESLLIVGRNDEATELSAQIRAELVALGRVAPEVIGTARDGNLIGVGDVIQARRNDWTIRVDGPGMVTNRVTYRVLGRDPFTGALRVADKNGLVAHLPHSYVEQHVTLAYAVTDYAAQGLTVDTGHDLVDIYTRRSSAYPGGTRGRECNTFYVVSVQEPDAHQPERLESTARAVMAQILANADADGTAAELERRTGVEAGRSLAFVGTQWDLLTAEYGRDRYTDTLAGLLPEGWMDQVIGETGYGRLMRTVREAELAGHDPAAVLEEAVTARGLVGADSVSDVLRWRIRSLTGDRTPERQVPAGDWAALTVPMGGPVGDYARVLAQVATARQRELGWRAAEELPAWALEHLGAPPADQQQRVEWERRAGIAAAYRDLAGVADTSISLGAAPSREQVFHRVLWQQAYAALGAPTDALDYAMASDSELRGMREDYRREQTWAPYYVAEELRDARLAAQSYRQDAVLWRAEAEQLAAGSPERAQADADLAQAEQLADLYAARAEHLAAINTARDQWFRDAAPARTRYEMAGDELVRRGLPRDPQPTVGEQTELFGVVEPDETPARQRGRDVEPNDTQLRLDLDLDRGDETVADEPVVVVRAPAQGEPAPGQEAGRDQHEHTGPRPTRSAQDLDDESLRREVVDENQVEFFAAAPAVADVAAAGPLRGEPGAVTAPEHGAGAGPVTVGEARRQAKISAALRAARGQDPEPTGRVQDWEIDRDQAADQRADAHRSRDHGEAPDRSRELTLDRDLDKDADMGMRIGF
nr:MobF family relaxase [Pseudonocardia acidicola]